MKTNGYRVFTLGSSARLIGLNCMAILLAAADVSAALDSNNEKKIYEPRSVDGVVITAVETYAAPSKNEFGLGVGLYPFDPYYSGVLLNAAYQYNLSRTWGWEIINFSNAFSFERDLRLRLARDFNVSPERIDYLKFLVSSNMVYTHTHGKFVLGQDYIKYFRSSAMAGLGLVNTALSSSMTVNIGLRFEVIMSASFAWRFEIRNATAFSELNNYTTFMLGTGLNL